MMTTSLEKAFTKAGRLPDSAQDQLASQLIDDIAAEMKWDKTLAKSQNLLEQLATKAREVHRKGKTMKRGFDTL